MILGLCVLFSSVTYTGDLYVHGPRPHSDQQFSTDSTARLHPRDYTDGGDDEYDEAIDVERTTSGSQISQNGGVFNRASRLEDVHYEDIKHADDTSEDDPFVRPPPKTGPRSPPVYHELEPMAAVRLPQDESLDVPDTPELPPPRDKEEEGKAAEEVITEGSSRSTSRLADETDFV